MSLNARQEKFCQCYALSLNATRAAIEAGYSKNYAQKRSSELLVKVGIADRIKSLTKPDEDNRIASIEERNAIASEIMRNIEADDKISTADRLRAMDILNKASGIYIEKREINHKGEVNHNLSFSIKPVAPG